MPIREADVTSAPRRASLANSCGDPTVIADDKSALTGQVHVALSWTARCRLTLIRAAEECSALATIITFTNR
jgi:hypothetical protein